MNKKDLDDVGNVIGMLAAVRVDLEGIAGGFTPAGEIKECAATALSNLTIAEEAIERVALGTNRNGIIRRSH